MNRLRWNVLANVVSSAWSTALALLLTPWYIRLLGVESYGLIGFYMSWVAILGILDTGISATAVREAAWLAARPDERERLPSLLRTLEITYWAVMVVIGVLLIAGAALFGASWFNSAAIDPSVVRSALMLMAISLIVQVPSGLYVGTLMGLQQQVDAARLLALFGTLRGAGAVAVLVLIRADIRAFFLWQIVASVLQTATIRAASVRHVAPLGHSRFSPALLSSISGFAGGMTVITALSLLLTQMDKLVLSRLVSLQALGLYMLAWTVASGLSRVATPLVQAFGPHFTELVATDDEPRLQQQLRVASQLMNALLLAPAMLMAVVAEPILAVWTGNGTVANGAAPLLRVLVIGTLLSSCAYPALSVLYSRKQLRPVILVNVVAAVVLVPVLVMVVRRFGAIGGGVSWAIYGAATYIAYQRTACGPGGWGAAVASFVRDLAAPAVACLAAILLAWHWGSEVTGRVPTALALAAALAAGWIAALVACRDLWRVAMRSGKWTSVLAH